MDLKNKSVLVFCSNYIYEGILEEMTLDVVVLREPRIVYVTGAWDDVKRPKGGGELAWKRAEKIPVNLLRIERCSVESMGELTL